MGCWSGALGRLTITPKPDDSLIDDYIYFSNHTCPKGYREDKIFPNTWFFDSESRLASCIGKYCEPEIWYDHLKKYFFEPKGCELSGDPGFVGEFDLDLWKLGEERIEEWREFRDRIEHRKNGEVVGT